MGERKVRCEIKVHEYTYRGQYDSDDISFVVVGKGPTGIAAVNDALAQIRALRPWKLDGASDDHGTHAEAPKGQKESEDE